MWMCRPNMTLCVLSTALDIPNMILLCVYVQTEHRVCAACSEPITDKYLLQVNGRSWHSHCLRCCVCQLALDRQPSCFIKDDSIYCKTDYAK